MKDKDLIRSRFDRAMNTYQANAHMQDEVAAHLMDILEKAAGAERRFRKVLEVGCGTGLLTRRIVKNLKPDNLWLNDLCPSAERFARACVMTELSAGTAGERVKFFAGDAESVPFPSGMDLIISSATVQWFDGLKAFFSKCSASLNDGGMLAFSTFGKDNAREITELEGIGLEYYGIDELKGFLGDRFEVLATEERVMKLAFGSPTDVLRHLRETGVTGLGKEKWTRGRLMSFARRYEELFSDGDTVSLTYNPIWIVAIRKNPASSAG